MANDTAVDGGGDSNSLKLPRLSPTLVTLPDLLLLKLFKMLPIRERGRLAMTCVRMNEIMHSASLWTHAMIQLDYERNDRRIYRADLIMTQMFGEYFRNVEVVLHSFNPSALSIRRVRRFAERGVLKRVRLQVLSPDLMTDMLMEPHGNKVSSEELEKDWCSRCDGIIYDVMTSTDQPSLYDGCSDIISRCDCLEPLQIQPATQVEVREMLTTNIDVTLELTQTAINADFVLMRLYAATNKSKACRSVSTLILPEIRQECLLSSVHPGQSQTPTASLISSFRKLQILQLSFHNLSEQLLQELSNTTGEQKRSQLKKLILLHKDFKIDMGRRFPTLSASTWCELTSACPGLSVECRVRVLSQRFPPLTDAIKPETPLIHLEVTVETDDLKDSDVVRDMQELCRQHDCPFLFTP